MCGGNPRGRSNVVNGTASGGDRPPMHWRRQCARTGYHHGARDGRPKHCVWLCDHDLSLARFGHCRRRDRRRHRTPSTAGINVAHARWTWRQWLANPHGRVRRSARNFGSLCTQLDQSTSGPDQSPDRHDRYSEHQHAHWRPRFPRTMRKGVQRRPAVLGTKRLPAHLDPMFTERSDAAAFLFLDTGRRSAFWRGQAAGAGVGGFRHPTPLLWRYPLSL